MSGAKSFIDVQEGGGGVIGGGCIQLQCETFKDLKETFQVGWGCRVGYAVLV